MPSINVSTQQLGPIIEIHVGPSIPFQRVLTAAGQPLPGTVLGKFLIDTGASSTCVDPEFIASLGLRVVGQVAIQTPSTAGVPHYCDQYDAMLFIPNGDDGGHLVEATPIMTTTLRPQGIDGLLGRDVLDKCTFIYNGTARMYTLAF